jgi:UDP-N-acetylglucosamine transferase subunit ALG13
MAFDRLICAMDKWAQEHSEYEVLAQIGDGDYQPNHMRSMRTLTPSMFNDAVRNAAIVVAHAGMGSYFMATEMGKPLVLLPRRASNREHTTDHQLHTAQWLGKKPGVYVALSEDELGCAVGRALVDGGIATREFSRFAPQPFLSRVRQFLVE